METWYDFECSNEDCTAVVDVRIPSGHGAPEISCPVCKKPMTQHGMWEANRDGSGSRGDYENIGQDPPGSLIP